MIKVCIFGQKDNGKSILAKMIYEEIYTKIVESDYVHIIPQRLSFAYQIKKSVSDMTGVSLEELDKYKNSKLKPPGWDCTVREVFQHVGESMRTWINPRVWVDRVLQGSYVIDDGRHLEEMEATRKDGSYNILIIDPDRINYDSHPSEFNMGNLASSWLDFGLKHENIDEVYVNQNRDPGRMRNYAISLVKSLWAKHNG